MICGCLEPGFEYHNTMSHFSFQVVIDYDDLVKIPYFKSEIESLTNEAMQL
ncbi:acyltransferase-like protein, partial [Trifolium medium]|nr:acyltransferase-like protein [Trifolium medium]